MGSSQTWEWQKFGTRIAIRDSEYDDSFIALILAENSDKQSKPNRIHNKFRAHGNTKTVAHRKPKLWWWHQLFTKSEVVSCKLPYSCHASVGHPSPSPGTVPKKMEETFHESKQPNAGTSYEIGTQSLSSGSRTLVYQFHHFSFTLRVYHHPKGSNIFQNGGNDFQIIGFVGEFLSETRRDTSATMYTLR